MVCGILVALALFWHSCVPWWCAQCLAARALAQPVLYLMAMHIADGTVHDPDCLPDLVALSIFWHTCSILLYCSQKIIQASWQSRCLSHPESYKSPSSPDLDSLKFLILLPASWHTQQWDHWTVDFFSSHWSLRCSSCTMARWCNLCCRTQHTQKIPPTDCSSYLIPRPGKEGRHYGTLRV